MGILVFTDTFCDANGVSRFLQDICSEAICANRQLIIFTSTSKTRCKSFSNLNNFKPLFGFKIPFYKELDIVVPPFLQMLKSAKNLDIQTVHISTPGPVGILGIYFAKKYNLKLTGTYHTNFPAYIFDNTKSKTCQKIAVWFMRWVYSKFDKILTRSSSYKEILENDLKINGTKIKTLKPGIKIENYSPQLRNVEIWEKYQISKTSQKVLYVGRLSKEKNFDFLLNVWDKFYQKYLSTNLIDAELIVVGEGSLDKKAKKLNDKNVHLFGFKGGFELAQIFASSDLFLFASVTETLGQVIMEAQASGLPAIVANVGGHLQIVGGGTKVLPIDVPVWSESIFESLAKKDQKVQNGLKNFDFMQSFSIKNSFDDFWSFNLSQN